MRPRLAAAKMKQKDLRLRLVIRRHGLPEVRVVFTISLESDPTIAKLLEHVNDTVPLEGSDWGLEDYVVELRDREGVAFDCLHFQEIQTILHEDEEVFIRPLFTEDRKKRLLSGRHQISADGKHLIDGVAFGRPRLKTPRGRPPVDIPPLKRRRITYDAEEEKDSEDEEEYRPMLITEHGEDDDDPLTVGVSAIFDDADDEGVDEGEDIEVMDESDLEDELRDLQQDIAQHDEPTQAETPEKANTRSPSPDNTIDLSMLSKITALRATFPEADVGRCEKVLLRRKNSLKKAYKKLRKSYDPQMSRKEMRKYFKSLAAPAPNHPLEIEEDVGDNGGDDDDDAAEDDESGAESVASIVKHYDQHGFPDGSILAGTASTHMAENMRKAGQLVKLPVHTKFDSDDDMSMAESPAPKKDKPSQKSNASSSDEDSDSSESGVDLESNADKSSKSDASESSDDDVDKAQQSESESSDEDSSRAPESGPESSDEASEKASESDSESSDDDDDDSGPEVASSKPTRPPESDRGGDGDGSGGGGKPDDDSSSSSSEEESDAEQASDKGQKNKSGGGGAPLVDQASSDSSADSSSDSSSSESDDDEPISKPKTGKGGTGLRSTLSEGNLPGRSQPTRTTSESTVSAPKLATMEIESASVPYGEGMSKTQTRNARRRAAKKEKVKNGAAGLSDTISQTSTRPSQDTAHHPSSAIGISLAERKQALLSSLDFPIDQDDAMIMGGPASHSPANQLPTVDSNATSSQPAIPKTPSQSQTELGQDGVSGTPTSSPQRRSKVDISAGRRMLFGALGIRNPKLKSDEDKIRADLMKGVRPLANSRMAEGPDTALADGKDGNNQSVEDEPESWRSKITYRAVECCHDSVELSEPPFPFVQRWDPQQQFWSGKGGRRGGQGKRKQRDDHAFYDEDDSGPIAKKRKFRDEATEGWGWDGGVEADVALNYDDEIPEEVHEQHGTEQSQFTDLDDLPSLPKDVSSLPELKQGQAAPGMVITWKQWLLSRATNWQPTISNVTAVVVIAEDKSAGLRVVLAKRDRKLDRTEKTFDEDGNRVYDRFEAPDNDDDDADEGTEDGYRSLQFSELMDPRILQQPLPSPQKPVLERIPETTGGDEVLNSIESEVNDSNGDGSGRSGDKSTTLDHEDASNPEQVAGQVDVDMAESIVPETFPVSGAQQPDSVPTNISTHSEEDVSISEDRRDEISLLISTAGFRKDISPSVLKKVPFDSPSEQLREMSESAAARDSRQTSASPSAAPPVGTARSSRRSLVASTNDAELPSEVDATPKAVEYPKLDVRASSASTTHSGRQPDADFGADWTGSSFIPFDDTADESMVLGNTPQQSRGESGNLKKARKPAMSSSPASAASVSSISSLPSLSEILSTARSSHNNGQSPSKAAVLSAIGARKSETIRDHEYEEMMRRLDEGDGQSNDENHSPAIETASGLGLNGNGKSKPTQHQTSHRRTRRQSKNATLVEAAAEEDASSLRSPSPISSLILPSEGVLALKKEGGGSTPSSLPSNRVRSPPSQPQTRRRAQQQSSSQFSVPSGSVVVSLMTSSPEPEAAEHYAEDHIDETYEDPGLLPGGSGWVKKAAHNSTRSRVCGGGGGRDASLPVTAAVAHKGPVRTPASQAPVNSQNDIVVSPEPRRTRRKTSARF